MLFLRAHGERPRDVLFGRGRSRERSAYGVPLIVVALGAGIGVLLAIRYFAPWLHTVEQNPLEGLLGSPRDAWLFALVVLVAGGIREEIQRAFLLHRFERLAGRRHRRRGRRPASAFGAGHLLQGYDAGIVTALLGAFWGVVYLRRRSAVAPMVSHAGFNLLQIVQFVVDGPVGVRLQQAVRTRSCDERLPTSQIQVDDVGAAAQSRHPVVDHLLPALVARPKSAGRGTRECAGSRAAFRAGARDRCPHRARTASKASGDANRACTICTSRSTSAADGSGGA